VRAPADVRLDTVVPVAPPRAHRTRLLVLRRGHIVVDERLFLAVLEQLCQADLAAERFLEDVVLDRLAWRQGSPFRGHFLELLRQRHLVLDQFSDPRLAIVLGHQAPFQLNARASPSRHPPQPSACLSRLSSLGVRSRRTVTSVASPRSVTSTLTSDSGPGPSSSSHAHVYESFDGGSTSTK